MALVRRYRIYCNTEASYVDQPAGTYYSSTPTTCPNNSEHSVDTGNIVILETRGDEHPEWFDGKPKFVPVMFPEQTYLQHTGAFDNGTSGRGAGTKLRLKNGISDYNGGTSYSVGNTCYYSGACYKSKTDTNQGNTPPNGTHWDTYNGIEYVEGSFADYVYLAGGGFEIEGSKYGDGIEFEVIAPATTVEANGSNEGNCTLYSLGGGFNMIIPAAGNGTHDYSNPVPIPNMSGTGFFDWDMPDTGLGTIYPNVNQNGEYDLYDFSNTLIRFLNKRPIIGSGDRSCTIPAIEPKILIPHWKARMSIINGSAEDGQAHPDLKVAGYLTLGRKVTL